ncbi:DegT/DnrJ/EryC1/StrS family aminotransferase [Saccharicrinis sp. FJH62]|uniref:DegT/DnrJ/EryC1/StrS family aminotransferase n=1 Tax=Saccharicrinis sp. FJH62 TaxID=3344657 RepID=UPI0035D3EC83
MITKSPVKVLNHYEQLTFTNSARIAFKLLLKHLKFKNEEKILLPAYIGITDREGSGVIDPIQSLSIKYEFYSINNNFKIDCEEIESRLKTKQYKALLIIHYFGFVHCNMQLVKTICEKHNVVLIEDCAHSFNSYHRDRKLGDFGDFSFFSIHKFFALENGGYLKNNTNDCINEELENHDKIKSETLESVFKGKLNMISEIRVKNYNYLNEKLSSISEVEVLFPKIEDGIVPMNFPILLPENIREKLYFYLMEIQIPTIALYYRLIEDIKMEEFAYSHYLSQNILNLPIHQSISFDDIDFIVGQIVLFFKSN